MRPFLLPHVGLAASLALCGCTNQADAHSAATGSANQTKPGDTGTRRANATMAGTKGATKSATKNAAKNSAFRTYAAADGRSLRSTLVVDEQSDGEHLAGVTHFEDGSCLSEEATTDRTGRLVRAEYAVSRPNADAHVLLDPGAGLVEVTLRGFQMRLSVPNDLPWVWAPQLDPASGGEAIATPLSALIALRGAHADHALRSIDLGVMESNTVMTDQVFVADGEQSGLVVVGDDAVDVRDGMPRNWHAGLLDRDIEARDADGLLAMLAAFSCAPVERSKT
jgi:hypothetical protein